jgi:hypothetical protein
MQESHYNKPRTEPNKKNHVGEQREEARKRNSYPLFQDHKDFIDHKKDQF